MSLADKTCWLCCGPPSLLHCRPAPLPSLTKYSRSVAAQPPPARRPGPSAPPRTLQSRLQVQLPNSCDVLC